MGRHPSRSALADPRPVVLPIEAPGRIVRIDAAILAHHLERSGGDAKVLARPPGLTQLANCETERRFRIMPALVIVRHRLPSTNQDHSSMAPSMVFDVACSCMFPNCDNGKAATSQICDAVQVDEDIRSFKRDLLPCERMLESRAGRGCVNQCGQSPRIVVDRRAPSDCGRASWRCRELHRRPGRNRRGLRTKSAHHAWRSRRRSSRSRDRSR
jgi:hypothetical protein